MFQWFYDGQSWVYASEQPEMKPPKELEEKVIIIGQHPLDITSFLLQYTFGGAEDPVQAAVMANIRGSWSNNAGKRGAPDKPKVRSLHETCREPRVCHVCMSCLVSMLHDETAMLLLLHPPLCARFSIGSFYQ